MNQSYSEFGPFRLSPTRRVVERAGVPLPIGDRALDILIVLVEKAGEVVSQRELTARVWRDLVVTPGNLRVHMSALRKALGDGEDGIRYIENVTGQGYSFVAPVSRSLNATTLRSASLPPALARMVGREEVVDLIADDLRKDRFVTIVGPGGMGKTTVAIAVAHAMFEEFRGNVAFVDIASIADPALLPATVASTLGLGIQSADPLATLVAFLQKKRMLLVLDNCEHVIDAAARLAESLFGQACEIHLLATSREALRVEGERAYWLRPLESPPRETIVNADQALSFPAVKLFVERATASDSRFVLNDSNAHAVAEICGRLDGIALALEFVASRVGTYGLDGMAELLDKRMGLHWVGKRTAQPRHLSLHALLEWSHDLLQPVEQLVLRRLSIFVGAFTLEAARAVAAKDAGDGAQFAGAIDQLIAKSLVSTVAGMSGTTHYRLLETTRAFAFAKLEESGDADSVADRHARYFTGLLQLEDERIAAPHEHLGNLRVALVWCFDGRGVRDPELAIELAAASVSVFLSLSLWSECRRWAEAALSTLPAKAHGGRHELLLQQALAIASLLTAASDARTAITRGLEIARHFGETAIHFRLLGALHVYLLRMTDFKAGLEVAREMDAVAKASNDPTHRAVADWMLGSSNYVLGNLPAARHFFEQGFTHGVRADGEDQQLAGLHYRTRALYGLGRVLWLCGFPDRGMQYQRQAVAEAAETASAFNVSYSLVYPCYVFLACGELDAAEEMIEKVMSQPHWQGRLVWFHTEALALKGELLVRRGNLDEGIELLRRAFAAMRESPQRNLMLASTACCLAEALALTEDSDAALGIIEDAIASAPGGLNSWDAPELMRVKAIALLSTPEGDELGADQCLATSIECARQQTALSWELRTTMVLARLRERQGRAEEGRRLLSAVYERFTEGFDTADLAEAKKLLQQLSLKVAG